MGYSPRSKCSSRNETISEFDISRRQSKFVCDLGIIAATFTEVIIPFGTSPRVETWTRKIWQRLNKDENKYGVEKLQCWLIRYGNAVPDMPPFVSDIVIEILHSIPPKL